MKKCYNCKLEKEESEFAAKATRYDGLNAQCRECHREYRKKHYEKNKQKYILKAKKYKKQQYKLFQEYKETLSCVICKENDSCCLDFHHLDPSKKEGSVPIMVGNSTFLSEKVQKEISKCVVLCSNCHRKVHAGKVLMDTRLPSKQ